MINFKPLSDTEFAQSAASAAALPKAHVTRCAEDILLARESRFPATIADLYVPDAMPTNLREAYLARGQRQRLASSVA